MYSIVYQDQSILIINKSQGISSGFGKRESVCSYVFKDFPQLQQVKGFNDYEGGLINRLDFETGGLLLFAKTNDAFNYYSQLSKNEQIEKKYIACVNGIPDTDEGIIDLKIAHHYKIKSRMVAIKNRFQKHRGNQMDAKTYWHLLEKLKDKSILDIKILKGVRHQIRVHLSSINLPIVGDLLYNKIQYKNIPYHLLFCYGLNFKNIENKIINIDLKDLFYKQIIDIIKKND